MKRSEVVKQITELIDGLMINERHIAENQAELIRAQSANYYARLDAIRALDVEIRKLTIQSQFANETEKKQIEEQIAALKERRNVTNSSFQLQNRNIEEYITRLQAARQVEQNRLLIEQDRLQTMENIKQSMEEQIARQQQLSDILLKIREQQQQDQFEISQRGRSPQERQIEQIKENARRAALEAGRAFAQAFQDTGDGLTPEKAAELAQGLELIAQGYRDIADRQIENLEASVTWNDGWKAAFEEYAKNAGDAASQAKRVFDTFSRSFEDTMVKFLRTGKLNFKEFADSIINEFLRIQAQKAFVSLFGTGGFFGSLFGFANGGPTEAMKPIIVGERGPELFIPKMAGNVISNQNLTKPNQSSMPTITNVTYNISAVDAPSFRALIARDPQFIYNVSEVGRRGQPNRRLA
jgi:lambda family phage tail tape measure protein